MVCSCAMSPTVFAAELCVNETTRDTFLREKKADRFAFRRYSLKNKLDDRVIKQLLNSVITKYRDLPVSRTSIIDLLATDKSLYFAQHRPIIVL